MNDDQLLRYSRHILLPEWGIEGQERLSKAHVLLIGAGGLGSPMAMYLAAAGIGHLTIVDHDRVEATNLQRQIAHTTASVGAFKVDSMAHTLKSLNPDIQINAIPHRADEAWLRQHVPSVDVVMDGSDNFATRQSVNAACVAHAKPLAYGAASGWAGQVGFYDPTQPDSPCYACLFPPDVEVTDQACAIMGVFAPVVGLIGLQQAADVLRYLSGASRPQATRLQLLDGRTGRWQEIATTRQASCSVCGNTHPASAEFLTSAHS